MKHFATPEFWGHSRQLPLEVRELADKSFALLSADPRHASVRLKKQPVGLAWFWIGPHAAYDHHT